MRILLAVQGDRGDDSTVNGGPVSDILSIFLFTPRADCVTGAAAAVRVNQSNQVNKLLPPAGSRR